MERILVSECGTLTVIGLQESPRDVFRPVHCWCEILVTRYAVESRSKNRVSLLIAIFCVGNRRYLCVDFRSNLFKFEFKVS